MTVNQRGISELDAKDRACKTLKEKYLFCAGWICLSSIIGGGFLLFFFMCFPGFGYIRIPFLDICLIGIVGWFMLGGTFVFITLTLTLIPP
jgi:hypothetical protein